MSKLALEALRDIGLLDKQNKVTPIGAIDPLELQKKLDYYRDTRIRLTEKDAISSLPTYRDMAALVSSVSATNAVIPLLPWKNMRDAGADCTRMWRYLSPHLGFEGRFFMIFLHLTS
jgi:hypothetical protein